MASQKSKSLKIYSVISTFMYEIIATVGISFLIGYFLDKLLNTVFVFKLVFIIIGVFAGIRNLIKRVYKVEKSDEE